MTEHRIATLAMRLFALYIGFRGIGGLARISESLVSSINVNISFFLVFGGLFSSIFFVLLAIVVWITAERLARYALPAAEEPDEQPEAAPEPLTARTILNVAFIILGVYLLTAAIISGTTAGGLWLDTLQIDGSANDELTGSPALLESARRTAYSAAGSLVAGFVLLLGARGLSTFFRRSWWAGTEEPTPSTEDEVIEVEVQDWPDER